MVMKIFKTQLLNIESWGFKKIPNHINSKFYVQR